MHCCANSRCLIEKRALLFNSVYEFTPTNFFQQVYVVAQGSFIEERHNIDDNSCCMCSAHGMLAMAMKLAL